MISKGDHSFGLSSKTEQHQVQAIGVTIHYTGEGQMLYQDPSCGGAAVLQTGETKWFSCDLRQIQGATNYNVQVTGVQFR